MNTTPMQAALTRAFWVALLPVIVTGLLTYYKTSDGLWAVITALSALVTVLGGRGAVEGSIDSVRAARAANGDMAAVSPADVGAYSPSLAAPPYSAPVTQPYQEQRGYQHPPQMMGMQPPPQRPPRPPMDAVHPLDR